LKVEYEEVESFPETEHGIKSPKVWKWGSVYLLRCFYCGDIMSLGAHNNAGMVHVENGVVDISGSGSHSIGNHWRSSNEMCPAHYHIYNGEVVLDCNWKPP